MGVAGTPQILPYPEAGGHRQSSRTWAMMVVIVAEAGGCEHVDRPQSWSLVVPVKAGPTAKSRLAAGRELATAIAADTLGAVARCADVRLLVVVCADGDWLRAVLPPVRRGL